VGALSASLQIVLNYAVRVPESFLGVAPSAPMRDGIGLSRVVLADLIILAGKAESLK
jgi:hypothetical protein